MIIVSQGKTAHINYDNIEATYLLKKDDKIKINMRGNYDYTIGEYETMGRAKEVLQEILEHYDKLKTNIVYSISDKNYPIEIKSYYEMPED